MRIPLSLFVFVLALLIPAQPLCAYSMIEKGKHRVYSPNRKYFVVVNPKSSKHTVYQVGFFPRSLWSFREEVQFESFYPSDDGRSVIVTAWSFVQKDDVEKQPAVRVFHQDGRKCVFSFRELSRPRPYRLNEVGPVGSFWRVWVEEEKQTSDGVRLLTAGRGWVSINAEICRVSFDK